MMDEVARHVGWVTIGLGAACLIAGSLMGIYKAFLYARSFYFPALDRVPDYHDTKNKYVVISLEQIEKSGAILRLANLLELLPTDKPFSSPPVVQLRGPGGTFVTTDTKP